MYGRNQHNVLKQLKQYPPIKNSFFLSKQKKSSEKNHLLNELALCVFVWCVGLLKVNIN